MSIFGSWTNFRFWSKRSFDLMDILELIFQSNPDAIFVDIDCENNLLFQFIWDKQGRKFFQERKWGDQSYFYEINWEEYQNVRSNKRNI
jgi:hypothetical protein